MKFFMAVAAFSAAITAFAQPREDAELLGAAQQQRLHGCRGQAGTAAPLRWSDELARAASRMAAGGNAMRALEAEGYRATRVFHSSFVGYRTAAEAADALAQHYCADLVEPRFTDLGAQHEGRHWTIVLAGRFELPKLANPRAASARVLALVNEARSHARRCGDRQFAPAPVLRWNDRLAEAAAQHAQDMASHRKLDHTGHDGSTPPQRITHAGYRWRSVGENVAAGQGSPEEVVGDWLSSPGHCANIMEPAFTEMGTAFAVNMKSDAAVYWAQEFGRPR